MVHGMEEPAPSGRYDGAWEEFVPHHNEISFTLATHAAVSACGTVTVDRWAFLAARGECHRSVNLGDVLRALIYGPLVAEETAFDEFLR